MLAAMGDGLFTYLAVMVEIIAYEDKYQPQFRQLNLEWLEKYNLAETHDFEVLNNPRKAILDAGGFIYLAMHNNEVVGTAALAKLQEGIYELVKMTVTPGYRGKGIGNILIQHCLTKARQLNADKVLLYSNSQLQTAINMYEKFGFKHIPVTGSPFVTADIKMELSL